MGIIRVNLPCNGKVKITAIEYANCTIVDRADLGKEAVSAVCTESPNEALYETQRNELC